VTLLETVQNSFFIVSMYEYTIKPYMKCLYISRKGVCHEMSVLFIVIEEISLRSDVFKDIFDILV
jgi:hypothetical protein